MGVGAGRVLGVQLVGAAGGGEGVRKRTTTPGTSSSRAAASIRPCNAAWLIGFSPEPAIGAAVVDPVENPRTVPLSTTLINWTYPRQNARRDLLINVRMRKFSRVSY